MFESINQISWKNLETVSNNGEKIPHLLHDLTSSQLKICDQASMYLMHYIADQGKLYDAAYYTIPFLLEILESSIQVSRHLIYDLLSELSIKRDMAFDKTIIIQGEETSLKLACRARVLDGRQLYYADLFNPSNHIRYLAFELLILFKEAYSLILTELGEFTMNYVKQRQKDNLETTYYESYMLREAISLLLNPEDL